jgi:hypothetical protein
MEDQAWMDPDPNNERKLTSWCLVGPSDKSVAIFNMVASEHCM